MDSSKTTEALLWTDILMELHSMRGGLKIKFVTEFSKRVYLSLNLFFFMVDLLVDFSFRNLNSLVFCFFLRFVCSFWGICMVYLKFLFYLKHATLSHVHIVPTLGNFLWILNWYWRNIINSSAFSLSLFECVLILKNYFRMYVLVYHHPSGLARCIFWGNIHYIMVLYVVCGSAQSSYNERTVCMLQCSVCTRCTLAFSFPFSVAR